MRVGIVIAGILLVGALFYFAPQDKQAPVQKPLEEGVQLSACSGHTPESFSCYAQYYRERAASQGVGAAITELRANVEPGAYTQRECHLLMHEIGRSIVPRTASVTDMFAVGDYFCDAGYYHGVMEGLIQKQGPVELTAPFLNGLCSPFRTGETFSAKHQNCSHGLGHGIMYVNQNEPFEALRSCDLLDNATERSFCWSGVFMENVITDFRDHVTNYLKPEDPMYPCTVVEEQYKKTCYGYQSAYVLKVTGDFRESFVACRNVPSPYQEACFNSIGRDALIDEFPENLPNTRTHCLSGTEGREQEWCVDTVVRILISNNHSLAKAEKFCSLLEGSLQTSCASTATKYYAFLSSQE